MKNKKHNMKSKTKKQPPKKSAFDKWFEQRHGLLPASVEEIKENQDRIAVIDKQIDNIRSNYIAMLRRRDMYDAAKAAWDSDKKPKVAK
jgi:hypothetical protein